MTRDSLGQVICHETEEDKKCGTRHNRTRNVAQDTIGQKHDKGQFRTSNMPRDRGGQETWYETGQDKKNYTRQKKKCGIRT